MWPPKILILLIPKKKFYLYQRKDLWTNSGYDGRSSCFFSGTTWLIPPIPHKSRLIRNLERRFQQFRQIGGAEGKQNLANMAWHWSLEWTRPSTRRGQVIIICLRTHGQSCILHARRVTGLGQQTGEASSYRTCRHPYRVNIQVNSLYCWKSYWRRSDLWPRRDIVDIRFPHPSSFPLRPPVLMPPRIL